MERGKIGFYSLLVTIFFILTFRPLSAGIFVFGESSVKIPAGSTFEVKGNIIAFVLEDGKLEIIPAPDSITIRALDKSGKLIYTGSQARLFSLCQPEKFQKLTVTDADYRFVKFSGGKPEPDPAGKAVVIPKGTNIEKVEEHLYRFHLPNGETVSFKCNLTSDGHIGDCTRYTKDWKIMYTRTKVKFCRMMSLDELKNLPGKTTEDLWVQFLPQEAK
ncbi:MAG: hypothetical protein ACPLRX_01285 [Candidatus Saccharicenans sp.]